jgi:hypothetical protein
VNTRLLVHLLALTDTDQEATREYDGCPTSFGLKGHFRSVAFNIFYHEPPHAISLHICTLKVGVGVLLAADRQSTSSSGYRVSFWDP